MSVTELERMETTETKPKFVGVYMGGGKLKNGEYKALVKFNGVPTAARIINVFNEVDDIERIVAITPDREEVVPHLNELKKPISFADGDGDFIDSARSVFSQTVAGESAILAFSDVLFLRAQSVRDLISLRNDAAIVIPAVWQRDVRQIEALRNLHFMPTSEGYIHLGSVVRLNANGRNDLDLDYIQELYRGKSFRTDPKKKFQLALSKVGFGGLIAAARIWLSANMQHKGMRGLDSKIPSHSIEGYSRMATKLLGVNTDINLGNNPDIFLDYDYPDDAEGLQKNYGLIEGIIDKIYNNG